MVNLPQTPPPPPKTILIVYMLSAYTRRDTAKVNMINCGSLSNFVMVAPLISFRQPEQLPVGVANNKPHTLPHQRAVNNSHPVTPYAKFRPYWSINEFLAGNMMPMGDAMARPHPLTHAHVISNAQPVAWKPHTKF